jgi:hypothetical protein
MSSIFERECGMHAFDRDEAAWKKFIIGFALFVNNSGKCCCLMEGFSLLEI